MRTSSAAWGIDPEARQRRELVESREVSRIAHRDRETPSLLAERHRVQALGHTARHEPEDVRPDLLESLRRGGRNAVLDREAVQDDLLGGLLLQECRPESSLLAGLPEDGTLPLLVCDERLFEEEVAQARHDYSKSSLHRGSL